MGKRFEGKVCIVTGAASGIGRAAALLLAAEGACLLVVDRDVDGGQNVAAQARGDAVFVHCDVSVADDVRTAVGHALQAWGRIDVLINNAGIMSFSSVTETDEATWSRVLNTNLTGAFFFSKYCIPHMQSGSSIVNITSVHAIRTTPLVASYAASNAGLEAFTRALCLECAELGIRVNSVAPGATDTPLLWSNPNIASKAEKLEGTVAEPEDVAAAIAFLASDDSRSINGASLGVDNGRLAAL